jgi:hypothetical protein
MAAPQKVPAFAVMCHSSTIGNLHNARTDIREVFDTIEQAQHCIRHDSKRELIRQYGELHFVALQPDDAVYDMVARTRTGEEFRFWIQLVDRTVGPQPPVAAPPNAPAPRTTYIIIRHDLQENQDSRMKNHDDAKIIGQAYESLLDANQDAHTYFINKACYGSSAKQRLMPGENKEEENVDSETELYRGVREVGMGDIDEIVVEVKALKIAPARRRPQQQQHQAPPAPPLQRQPPAPPSDGRQIPGRHGPAVPPRAPHQAPPAPPQTGRQVPGASNRSVPSVPARAAHQAPPAPLQIAQQNVGSSKRAAPPNPSSGPASKQRRVDPSDDDDEVVCLS